MKKADRSDNNKSEKTQDVGFLIKNISDKINKLANSFLKKNDVTFSQVKVLHFLSEQENYCATQKKIETFLQVSHPAVTGIISRLEEKGFVTSEISVNRRLTKIVKLTEEGLKNDQDTGFNKDENEKVITQGLTEAEKTKLIKLLLKVNDSLEDFEKE